MRANSPLHHPKADHILVKRISRTCLSYVPQIRHLSFCGIFFFSNQLLTDEFVWKFLVKPWTSSAEQSQVCIYYSPSFQGTFLHYNHTVIEQWYKTGGNESRLLVSKLLNVKLLFVSLRGFLKREERHQSDHARNWELFKAWFSTASFRSRAT